MNVPLIGQKQQVPWGIQVGLMPDGNVSIVISQGIMGVQAPLSLAQAKELAASLAKIVDQVENQLVAASITNGRVAH